jgi:hypothetical protein
VPANIRPEQELRAGTITEHQLKTGTRPEHQVPADIRPEQELRRAGTVTEHQLRDEKRPGRASQGGGRVEEGGLILEKEVYRDFQEDSPERGAHSLHQGVEISLGKEPWLYSD